MRPTLRLLLLITGFIRWSAICGKSGWVSEWWAGGPDVRGLFVELHLRIKCASRRAPLLTHDVLDLTRFVMGHLHQSRM
jgi:hypothetical protein